MTVNQVQGLCIVAAVVAVVALGFWIKSRQAQK